MSHHARTGTHPPGVPGLAETLQVKVTHVETDASRVLALYPDHGEVGRYTAHFIPTEPGAYQVRVFGSVEREPVNEYFDSGSAPGDLTDVRPSEDLELSGSGNMTGRLALAYGLSIAATVLGGVGLIAAAVSLWQGMRRRKAG